jgi:hypothetical protein
MTGVPSAGRSRPWSRWPLLTCAIALGVAGGIIIACVSCLAVIGYFAKEALEEEEIASHLSLGQPATIDGLQVVIDRYEMPEVGGRAPAPGAQFLWVHIAVQNVGDVPIDEAVLVKVEYKGGEVYESWAYDEAHPGFPASVQLFPGIASEGWAVFEVPVGVDLSEVTVVFEEIFRLPPKVASWRLVEPEKADGR